MNTALDIFTAQDMLNQFKVSSFPTMEDKHRDRLHRDVYMIAHPNLDEYKPKVLSLKDLAHTMNRSR